MRVENPAVHYFLLLPALWYNFQSVADRPGIFWYIHPPILRHLPDSGTLQLRGYRRGIHWYYARLHHAGHRNFLRHFTVRAGGINYRKYLVPFRDGADGWKSHADTGNSTGDDQRFTACRFYRLYKIGIIPALISLYARHIARGVHSHGFPESADHLVPVVRMR